jgi:electron transfer flavoprotein beta subunit
MRNMRTMMPALQKARIAPIVPGDLVYASVAVPQQQRTTRIEKNMTTDDIAREIVQWVSEE